MTKGKRLERKSSAGVPFRTALMLLDREITTPVARTNPFDSYRVTSQWSSGISVLYESSPDARMIE